MDATSKTTPVEPWNPDKGPSQFAPGVTCEEFVWGDVYSGRIDAMVAAGIVHPDRIPGAPGMNKTMLGIDADGQVVPRGKIIKDGAGWKRIRRQGCRLRVSVHGSQALQDARFAGRDLYSAQQQKAAATKSAEEKMCEWEECYMRENPAACLERMPRNSLDFCKALIQDIRNNFHFCLDRATRTSYRHGFKLTAEAAESAALAFDAVSEALLSGEVAFDASRQTAIVHKLHAYLVQAGKGAPQQVAHVLRVNPSILAGEAA